MKHAIVFLLLSLFFSCGRSFPDLEVLPKSRIQKSVIIPAMFNGNPIANVKFTSFREINEQNNVIFWKTSYQIYSVDGISCDTMVINLRGYADENQNEATMSFNIVDTIFNIQIQDTPYYHISDIYFQELIGSKLEANVLYHNNYAKSNYAGLYNGQLYSEDSLTGESIIGLTFGNVNADGKLKFFFSENNSLSLLKSTISPSGQISGALYDSQNNKLSEIITNPQDTSEVTSDSLNLFFNVSTPNAINGIYKMKIKLKRL